MEKRTPGKKIVPVLYGVAVLMCAALLWHGLNWRRTNAVSPPLPEADRVVVAQLPREWTRINLLEGQGWVVFVPCGSEAGALVIEAEEESPRLLCAYCDTIQEATVRRVSLRGLPSRTRLKLGGMGEAVVEPVDEAVAGRFEGAPVRDYVLTWTLPGGEKMFFVPSDAARDIEVIRAEDESPEGCGVGEE